MAALGGPPELVVYGAEDCGACAEVERRVIGPLAAAGITVHRRDVKNPDHYAALLETEARVGLRGASLPIVVVEGQLLSGPDEIMEKLPALLDALGTGAATVAAAPVVAPVCGLDCAVEAPIWAAYFHQPGCKRCSRAEAEIAYVRRRHPNLVIDRFDVYDRMDLALWLAERAGREFTTPAIFVGDDALLGDEVRAERIEALVAANAGGAPRFWIDRNEGEEPAARFRSWGPIAVLGAGLLDGVNPCAFATLVFLVSYLAAARRRGREILAVGGAFTAGVFIAYLAVGFGLHHALDAISGTLEVVGRWVTLVTAALCLVLAGLSLHDFVKARRGALAEMSLTLPEPLRKRINAVIRRSARAPAFVWAALVAGLVVSLIELACTGQVYLPTIVFLTAVPELRVRAYAYLILYNVMFVVPLIVVFVLAYAGTTSKTLEGWLSKNAARVKLGMAALFAVLGGWLVVTGL